MVDQPVEFGAVSGDAAVEGLIRRKVLRAVGPDRHRTRHVFDLPVAVPERDVDARMVGLPGQRRQEASGALEIGNSAARAMKDGLRVVERDETADVVRDQRRFALDGAREGAHRIPSEKDALERRRRRHLVDVRQRKAHLNVGPRPGPLGQPFQQRDRAVVVAEGDDALPILGTDPQIFGSGDHGALERRDFRIGRPSVGRTGGRDRRTDEARDERHPGRFHHQFLTSTSVESHRVIPAQSSSCHEQSARRRRARRLSAGPCGRAACPPSLRLSADRLRIPAAGSAHG